MFEATVRAELVQMLGAGGFGAIIGWFIYYVNRYRKADVQLSDITTLIGAIGGAAVLAIFPARTDLFGAYGIGLSVGFFGYYFVLVILVAASKNFDADFFLDGRRKRPTGDYYIPGADEPGGGQHPLVTTSYFGLESNITAKCKQLWPATKYDCHVFVEAVAHEFNIAIAGDADAIMATITGPGWTQIKGDTIKSAGVKASEAAAAGKFVIAGKTSAELGDPNGHGHVVIVVPPTGPLAHGKYPYAYWGSLNPAIRDKGGEGTTLNWSFSDTDRDTVHYAYI